jgi:hypothetical protein
MHKVLFSNNQFTKGTVHEKLERHEKTAGKNCVTRLFVLSVSFVDLVFSTYRILGCSLSGLTYWQTAVT